MLVYLKRLAEQVVLGGLAAGVPVLVGSGHVDKASLAAAGGAALLALYGIVAKAFGDLSRPTVVK